VILDTGSGVCAFPCASCPHCGKHIDPNFDIAKSSTAKWMQCGFACHDSCKSGHCSYHQGYQEGSSITGYWFEDWIRLGDGIQRNPAVFTKLGCHQDENKLFYTQQANGIMGIRGGQNLLQTLFQDREHIESKVFSICLAEWGGRLTVGGYNQSYHAGKIVWVALTPSSFQIPLESMKVVGSRGRTITGFGHAMVDSGTTYTYMSTRAYRALRKDIEAHCKANDCGATNSGTCWAVPSSKLNKFPVVEIILGGAKTFWTPRAYLFRKGTSNQWCYSFQDDGPGASTVLGASWMIYQDVIFDLRSNKLGIVRANCPAYRKRPQHSTNHLDPPTVAEWTAMPRAPLSSRGRTQNSSSSAEDDDAFFPDEPPYEFLDEEEGFVSRMLGSLAGKVVAFFCLGVLLCGLGRLGFKLLRRIGEEELPKAAKHTKLGQVDNLEASPQTLGEAEKAEVIGDEDS